MERRGRSRRVGAAGRGRGASACYQPCLPPDTPCRARACTPLQQRAVLSSPGLAPITLIGADTSAGVWTDTHGLGPPTGRHGADLARPPCLGVGVVDRRMVPSRLALVLPPTCCRPPHRFAPTCTSHSPSLRATANPPCMRERASPKHPSCWGVGNPQTHPAGAGQDQDQATPFHHHHSHRGGDLRLLRRHGHARGGLDGRARARRARRRRRDADAGGA